MRRFFFRKLEPRLVATVGLGLFMVSLIGSGFTYSFVYRNELKLAVQLQDQLVRTVQAQAEVAAFAINREIAHGVLSGLLANPVVLAARIEAPGGFKVEQGSRRNVDFSLGKAYRLYSPVDQIEPIGTLIVVQNDDKVEAAAAKTALFQVLVMLVQVLIASVLMAAVLRLMLIKPIIQLAGEMKAIRPGSSGRLEIAPIHASDEIGLLAQSANAILAAAEAALAEVNAQRNELERLATHDHLTGLLTMRLADDRLQVACSGARRSNAKVALLFIDLDGFKAINDQFGHEVGDEVLKMVASRLRENVRAEDTAARIGGDEFVLVLGNLPDPGAAAQVAENIGLALARPIDIDGRSMQVGASIGIAIFPDHSSDLANLRRMADRAMYRVKNAGKGCYAFFDSAIDA